MTRLLPSALLALALTGCSRAAPKASRCGPDTSVVVARVGGDASVRAVHLTPVCKGDSLPR